VADRIYIVGCARSGTTLLRRLFHAFGNCEVIPYEIDLDSFAAMEAPEGKVLVGKRTVATVFSNQLPADEGQRQIGLLRSRPDIRTLCIYRDGRDVVESEAQANPARWLSSVHQMVAMPDLALSVQYEELVADPDGMQATLANHYGLRVDYLWSEYPRFFPGDDHVSRYAPQPIGAHRMHKDPVKWRRLNPWLAPQMEQALEYFGYLEGR
jgi:hypothetical protein